MLGWSLTRKLRDDVSLQLSDRCNPLTAYLANHVRVGVRVGVSGWHGKGEFLL